MKNTQIKKIASNSRDILSFFFPKKMNVRSNRNVFDKKFVVAVIPTYRPLQSTYDLAFDIIRYHKNTHVIVVDDSTPLTKENRESVSVLRKLKTLAKSNKNLTILRTPENRLKAGALNFGIEFAGTFKKKPDAVLTFDDDVIITSTTIPNMINALYSRANLGVVCSVSRVKNKHENILTRLQALEYHSFNVAKIADDGFLKGPLVMQGMLSAFRYSAIKKVKGFKPGHLIEDYDITARIKKAGWQAGIAYNAVAWTYVQETLPKLWKQRVRWSYGGIGVVKQFWRDTYTVFQDLVGHSLFVALVILIIASFAVANNQIANPILVAGLIIVSIIQFIISFWFNLFIMFDYDEKDLVDWIIKFSVLPEFIYSNILTLVLIGSYLFFVFNAASNRLVKLLPNLSKAQTAILGVFEKFGYSVSWGTRK